MNEQSIVAVAGVGLMGATFWRSPQRTAIDTLVWDGKSTPAAKTALVQMGGETVLLLVMYLLAGQSSELGLSMIAVIVTLWVLWFMTVHSRQTTATTNAKKG